MLMPLILEEQAPSFRQVPPQVEHVVNTTARSTKARMCELHRVDVMAITSSESWGSALVGGIDPFDHLIRWALLYSSVGSLS